MSRIDDLIQELVPEGVPFKTLASLGRRNSGTAMTAAKMKTIGSEDGLVRIFAGGQTIADVAEDAVPAKDIIRQPSIIVKSRGHVGFSFYERPFTHKAELWSYTLTDPSIDQKFAYYYLLTKVHELQGIARATSVKLPQLAVRDTDNLRIPVPPLEVQAEIVRILDQFTELEAELDAELEARALQYVYYRDELLTFAEAADEVQRVPMGELGQFIRGRRFTKDDFVAEGIPSVHYGEIYTYYGTSASDSISHVREDLADQLRYAKPGDVIIASVGETVEDVGKAVAWLGNTDVAIHDDTFAFRSDADPTYIAYVMQTAEFSSQKEKFVARAKVKRVGAENLGKIVVPVPPLAVQHQIVSILNKLEALVTDVTDGIPAELKARRKQYEYYRDKLLTFKETA